MVDGLSHVTAIAAGQDHTLAKIGDDGKVCLSMLAATHLIADVNAYYS